MWHQTEDSHHPHDVARGHRQLELLIHTLDPTVDRLADASHRLAPAEVRLTALALRLVHRVAGVPGRSQVDRTATLSASGGWPRAV